MHALMLVVSARLPTRVDMIEALGSFGTGRTGASARTLGLLMHSIGGGLLGLVYLALFVWIGAADRPSVVLFGSILGFAHGLVVCYGLLYWVSLHHPVEAYRRAPLPVGLVHLAGHILFGTLLGAFVYFFI